MNPLRYRLVALAPPACCLCTLFLLACGGNDATEPTAVSLRVTASTTGQELDSDGYTVTVDGARPQSIDVNGTVTFSDLIDGTHSIELRDVASSCVVGGDNPRNIQVSSGSSSQTTFTVSCSATIGAIEVTTSTTGKNLDPDGYTVTVGGGHIQTIAVNAVVTISGLYDGDHVVELTGLARNCGVVGDSFRLVSVSVGSVARVTFDITCDPMLSNQIVFVSDRDGNSEIYSMDVDGSNVQRLTNDPRLDYWPAVSPDGTQIAFTRYDSGADQTALWLMSADGTNVRQLTSPPATYYGSSDQYPSWSPDGSQIVFHSHRGTSYGNQVMEVWVVNADGTGLTQLTFAVGSDKYPDWSPTGSKITFVSTRDGGVYQRPGVYTMNTNGSGVTLIAGGTCPAWSPDGSKIAFHWNNLGDSNIEIYVVDSDGSNQIRLTNHSAGDYEPSWSPDGSKIVFHSRRDGDAPEVYVMNADGSGLVNLTNNTAEDTSPFWVQ